MEQALWERLGELAGTYGTQIGLFLLGLSATLFKRSKKRDPAEDADQAESHQRLRGEFEEFERDMNESISALKSEMRDLRAEHGQDKMEAEAWRRDLDTTLGVLERSWNNFRKAIDRELPLRVDGNGTRPQAPDSQ